MGKEEKMVNQVNYKFQYGYCDALCFIYKDNLQIYKLYEDYYLDSKVQYDLYKSINLKENVEVSIDDLTYNTIYIVRLIYDRENKEEFSITNYINFLNVDIDNIINNSMLYEIIYWLQMYLIQITDIIIEITSKEDIKRLIMETTSIFTIETKSAQEVRDKSSSMH